MWRSTSGAFCTSVGVGSATRSRLAVTSAVLGIHLASAPAATAATAPMPASLKNCRRLASRDAAVPARPIGWAAPVRPALGLSCVDCPAVDCPAVDCSAVDCAVNRDSFAGDDHQGDTHADGQRGLVVLAEGPDGEFLQPLRGELDERLAERVQR